MMGMITRPTNACDKVIDPSSTAAMVMRESASGEARRELRQFRAHEQGRHQRSHQRSYQPQQRDDEGYAAPARRSSLHLHPTQFIPCLALHSQGIDTLDEPRPSSSRVGLPLQLVTGAVRAQQAVHAFDELATV
jgi:hypothetical protein